MEFPIAVGVDECRMAQPPETLLPKESARTASLSCSSRIPQPWVHHIRNVGTETECGQMGFSGVDGQGSEQAGSDRAEHAVRTRVRPESRRKDLLEAQQYNHR